MPDTYDRPGKNTAYCSRCNTKHIRPVGPSCPFYASSRIEDMSTSSKECNNSSHSSFLPMGQQSNEVSAPGGHPHAGLFLYENKPSHIVQSLLGVNKGLFGTTCKPTSNKTS